LVRVTWEPEFCPKDNKWRTGDEPKIDIMPTGDAYGIAFKLEHVHRFELGVEHRGRVYQCAPIAAKLGGGTGCVPLADATITGMVDGDRVLYRWKMKTSPWVRKTGGPEGIGGGGVTGRVGRIGSWRQLMGAKKGSN